MSSSEYSQSGEKEEVLSDSSDDDQSDYLNKYNDSENSNQNEKCIILSQESSTNSSELGQMHDNVITNLIHPRSVYFEDKNMNEIDHQNYSNQEQKYQNTNVVVNSGPIEYKNNNSQTDFQKTINNSRSGGTNQNSSIENASNSTTTTNEVQISDNGYSGNGNKSFNQYSANNFEEKSLEPKLPPLHDIKTVGQYSPSPQSPRPQIYPPSPKNSNAIRILPPPQRRRSPITRRRQINTPKDNNSYRRNYEIIQPNNPTDEENALIKRILKGETINFNPNDPNTIDLINNLIIHLQQLRKQKAIERNYRDGLRLNRAITTLEQQRSDILTKMNQSETMRHLNNEYEEFKKRKEKFENETAQMVNKLKSKQNEQKENMQKLHDEKEQKLFQDWTQGKQIKMYNRSSNELTSLRRQHAFLLVQNRFEEAQKIGQEIEQKQNEELMNSHEEHQKDYDTAYDMLYEKNKEEDEFFENKCAIEMASLMQKRNKEKRALENKEKWFIQKKKEIAESDKNNSPKTSPRNSGMTPYRKPLMPSSKMTRKELGGSDVAIFQLPQITNRRDIKRKIQNNRK